MSATTMPVELHEVTVRYERTVAIELVSLRVAPGSVVGIVGPNGSGKSTLLKVIAGLVEPAGGTVRVFGKPPHKTAAGTIGYVPQVDEVDLAFPVSVRNVVAMGRYPRRSLIGGESAHDRSSIERAIEALSLGDLLQRPIADLSGGQRQRAFVARALAQEPDILLLDEPTTGIDAATEDALKNIVRKLAADGLPVLMSTHGLHDAAEWFDRVIVIDRTLRADCPPSALATMTFAR